MDVQKHNLVGIELLRIIAMMMVVGLHYLNFGGILWSEAVMNRRIAWGIEAFLFVAVNCYVLISGYFLVKRLKIFALVQGGGFVGTYGFLCASLYAGCYRIYGQVESGRYCTFAAPHPVYDVLVCDRLHGDVYSISVLVAIGLSFGKE